MGTLHKLADKWRDEAIMLRNRYADERSATLIAEMVKEFEDALDTNDVLLNLQQAATESGYSASHLGRLVNEGKIPNAGRKNAPLIRRSDLPVKPGLRSHKSRPSIYESRNDRIARAIVSSGR